MATAQVTNIRIVDRFLLAQIEAEQQRREDSTPTKTAQKLISERLAQIEMLNGQKPRRERRTVNA
jgi:hypothetical protein